MKVINKVNILYLPIEVSYYTFSLKDNKISSFSSLNYL
jgi:hypothetical protein